MLLRGNFIAEISLRVLATEHGCGASPFHGSALPASLDVASVDSWL